MSGKLIVKVNNKVISNENIKILQAIKSLDIDELQEDEVKALAGAITSNVNVNKMREAVQYACKDLSQVGPPSFGADAAYLAMDNQERLELVFKLLNSFGNFESIVNCLRRNKNNCRNNYDQVYSLLLATEDLADAVLDHSDFKIKEREENNAYVELVKLLQEETPREKRIRLEKEEKKLLEGGN